MYHLVFWTGWQNIFKRVSWVPLLNASFHTSGSDHIAKKTLRVIEYLVLCSHYHNTRDIRNENDFNTAF